MCIYFNTEIEDPGSSFGPWQEILKSKILDLRSVLGQKILKSKIRKKTFGNNINNRWSIDKL